MKPHFRMTASQIMDKVKAETNAAAEKAALRAAGMNLFKWSSIALSGIFMFITLAVYVGYSYHQRQMGKASQAVYQVEQQLTSVKEQAAKDIAQAESKVLLIKQSCENRKVVPATPTAQKIEEWVKDQQPSWPTRAWNKVKSWFSRS
jgi:hypothetical protein